MPYSGTYLDYTLVNFLKKYGAEVHTVLDVGVGAGKFEALVHSVLPTARMVGVEPVSDYHQRFSEVYTKYSSVRMCTADALFRDPDDSWDLVVLGDVLEHMRKSAGLDLLHFLVYRCKYIYIQYPTRYIQNPADIDGVFEEAHISVWDATDFHQFDFSQFTQLPLNVALIDGYLSHTPVVGDKQLWQV